MSTKPDDAVHSVLIGLGGNVGDVVQAMQRALNAIHSNLNCEVRSVSKVYRTPPWGITEQAWFFNACAEVATTLEPDQILDLLLTIEIAQGRVRDERWGPRTLDLDIIAYDDLRLSTDRLTLPHPRLTERAFVLVPLMDICPDREIDGVRIKDYAANLETGDVQLTDKVLKIGVISSN